jgi:hypothetical protein
MPYGRDRAAQFSETLLTLDLGFRAGGRAGDLIPETPTFYAVRTMFVAFGHVNVA